jgi:hypothetical protein
MIREQSSVRGPRSAKPCYIGFWVSIFQSGGLSFVEIIDILFFQNGIAPDLIIGQ